MTTVGTNVCQVFEKYDDEEVGELEPIGEAEEDADSSSAIGAIAGHLEPDSARIEALLDEYAASKAEKKSWFLFP